MSSPVSKHSESDGRDAILLTKLAPPRFGSANIERSKLTAKRDLLGQSACINVVAPAGFGKTTLLSQWYEHCKSNEYNVAWLTCDEADHDVFRLARHLIAALARSSDALDKALSPGADSSLDVNVDAVGIAIVNALEKAARQTLLIVDDFHMASSLESSRLLGFLVNSHSQYLHLAISSREQLKFSLARLKAQGKVIDIDHADLEFEASEAKAVISQSLVKPPDDNAIERITAHTGGWVTGIRLATLSLSENPSTPLTKLLSGKEPRLNAYLREEVVSHLSKDLAEFVADTALLGEFSAELADHVRRDDLSDQHLARLQQKQFFIMPLEEPGWFRYHPLFVEAFSESMTEFHPIRKSDLHQRAADWLETNHLFDRALYHADAADMAFVLAGLLSRVAINLIQTGRASTLLRYARKIPPDMLQNFPDLQLDRIYAATLTWQFSEAKRVLDDVRAAMQDEKRVEDWTADDLNIPRLERKLIHREMQLLLLQDKMPKVEKLALQWQAMEGSCTLFEDAVAQTTLIYAQRELFDCSKLASSKSAREIFEVDDNRWATIWHDCIIGATHSQIGNLSRAERVFNRAFQTAEGLFGRTNTTTAMPALYLAELKYERNSLDDAKELIEEFLPLATKTGLVDQLVSGFQTSARIAGRTSTDEALRILEQGEEIASARQFDRLKSFLLTDRIRIFASAGEVSTVRRIAMLNNIPSDMEDLKPRRNMTSIDAANAFAAAQIAIVENELSEAESLLGRWMNYLEARQCLRYALKMAVALAHAQIVMGEANSAHRTLRSALQMGGPNGFVRTFADANPAVRAAFESLNLEHQTELAKHHAEILAALGQLENKPAAVQSDLDETGGQYEALNDREAEILLMISTGMMNKQIAAELGLTLGTVKWYLQQVYTKMGVNRRSEAVFKARQLGLIA